MSERVCAKCGVPKDIDSFRVRSAPNQHLRHNICADCQNSENKSYRQKTGRDRYKVLWQYNMTREQYADLLDEQDGVCKICKQPPLPGKNLNVDHDHRCCPARPTCGECTRGLLCDACNKGLGQFRDNPQLLVAAANYVMGGD